MSAGGGGVDDFENICSHACVRVVWRDLGALLPACLQVPQSARGAPSSAENQRIQHPKNGSRVWPSATGCSRLQQLVAASVAAGNSL